MGLPTSNGLTVRIQNLPPETDQAKRGDVSRFFTSRLGRNNQSVIAQEGVGPLVTEVNRGTKQTTVTFASLEHKKSALKDLDEISFLASQGGHEKHIHIDDDFLGLTVLYENADPNVDIVALHGLSGHAWNTFSSTHNGVEGVVETCWLQKELPSFLEQQQNKQLRPRVMTFGYNANIWINATVDGLQAPVNALINHLKLMRNSDPMRPLLFVGHSLGGIVIKQVINDLVTGTKQQDPNYVTPITGCLFLAVPHKGTGNADDLERFLRKLKKVLLPGMGPNLKFVEDLRRKSLKMASVSDRFVQVLNTNSIGIISCYEQQPYNKSKGPIVSKESATLDYGRPHTLWPINANHSGIAAFGSVSQHPFVEIASELADYAQKALDARSEHETNPNIMAHPDLIGSMQRLSTQDQANRYTHQATRQNRRDYQKEGAYYKLTRYTTTFLVDDSSSMEDIPESELAYLPNSEGLYARAWTDTVFALRRCGNIITNAGGRLKIHFFNNDRVKEDPSGPEDIAAFCHSVIPHGDTPTYDRLKEHLDEFLETFERLSATERSRSPGLNLIIFTDGAPEGPFEDIEEVIVDTVKRLEDLRANKNKIGIQFVQIGKDPAVAEFFRFLDDRLKGKHNLKQDVVDTVPYDPVTADEAIYEKIVLGAIDKGRDALGQQALAGASADAQATQPRYNPIPMPAQGSQGPSRYSNLPPELVAAQTWTRT